MERPLIRLEEAAHLGPAVAGGKASNLARLRVAGLPVPGDGWVIPVQSFWDHLSANGLEEAARRSFEDQRDLVSLEGLRASVGAIDLGSALREALTGLPASGLAVRSSATVEDGSGGSYSGMFASRLGVGHERLADAITSVWASVFTPELVAYHRQHGQDVSPPGVAVLIMQVLDACIGGVAFSADPIDGDPFRICVGTCQGLPTRLVTGTEAGSRHVLDLDSLDVLASSPGHQTEGDFLQPDGTIATQEAATPASLTPEQLREVGSVVRQIDDRLDCRVDVEFCFTGEGIQIVQARPLLGLPAFFPDAPSPEEGGTQHSTWSDPVPVLIREAYSGEMVSHHIPPPPWSLEGERFWFLHGRAFGYADPDPTQPWDHTPLRDLPASSDPELLFETYHAWTEGIYGSAVPELRGEASAVLAWHRDELAALDSTSLADLYRETLELQRQAHVLYVSCTWPTSYYPHIAEKLLQDWLDLPRYPEGIYSSPAEQLAMDMVQGSPSLLHERSMSLEDVAAGALDLEDFACQWGYSYVYRDEQIYLHRWRSWREDPYPVTMALDQMARSLGSTPVREELSAARRRADQTLSRTLDQLRSLYPQDAPRRLRILQALVRFGRAHFRMKDDRDLIWSHAQSAWRWVVMEVARRLVHSGALSCPDDAFLLTSDELIGALVDARPAPSPLRSLIETRRREHRRLARLSGVCQPRAGAPAPPDGPTMIGIPTGSGIAEGRAHVVHEATALEDLAALEPGDILVFVGECKLGLTLYFPQIAGLVNSDGNGFSHEVNILRELGKPAIVLGANTRLIQESERIRIDASTGILTRLDVAGSGG